MRLNAAALRALRQRSGMSVKDLAEAAGINASYLTNLEKGHRENPSDPVIVALAKALKVNLPAILADPTEVPS